MPSDAATQTRRPRTLAGANPPQIAVDVTRVVACADAAVGAVMCCTDLAVTTVIEAELSWLNTRLTLDVRAAIVGGAANVALAHQHPGAEVASDLRERLEAAFDTAQPPGNLDLTIAALVRRGIDGNAVTWHVISRESIKHEGLIHKECNRLVRSLPDRTPDELKGYGWAGLRVALRNYDPELGFAFSTYACPKINGAIRDGVRAESPIPKRLTTFLRKVSHAEETLTQQLCRTPTYDEIARFVDSSNEPLHLVPRLAPAASLEELALGTGGEHSREPACLVDGDDPETATLILMRDEALHAAVAALPEDESLAVRLLLLEELPVAEAAAIAGVEARQLRIRKQRGLRALEPVMRAWMDEHQLSMV